MKPKIAQPSLIGKSLGEPGAGWPTTRHQKDPRLLAAETPLVEIGVPLIEVEIWLRYREMVMNNTSLMMRIYNGGENCFDSGWCHMAKTNMTGNQTRGTILDRDISYRADSPVVGRGSINNTTTNNDDDDVEGRPCVVFYQTPMQHINKKSRTRDDRIKSGSHNLCPYFRGEKGVVGAGGLYYVYELFNAPS